MQISLNDIGPHDFPLCKLGGRSYSSLLQSLTFLTLSWLCLTSLGSPFLSDLSHVMGPLGNLLQEVGGAVGGAGGAGGAGVGGAGAGGGGTGLGTGVGTVVGGLPVTTSPVVPAMMMSSVLPGIGIGLLAGTVIAELLIGKSGDKKHPAGYNYHQPRGYDGHGLYGYEHDQYGHHKYY